MDQLDTLHDVLIAELRDIYSAEVQITRALPKLIKKVSSEQLRKSLSDHLKETEKQIDRLEMIAKSMDFNIGGVVCQGMKGLLEEGEEACSQKSVNAALIDACIIGAAQRVEHYEIAAYGTARTMAEFLGNEKVVELLQETLDEEGRADKILTDLSEEEILPSCFEDADEAANMG